jgi:tetratricopeptide (TPR) repeat protein
MIRAQLLSCRGRHDEAIQEASIAVDLDPVHTRAHMHLTMCLYYARNWEACVRAGRAGLEVCPDPYIGIYTSLALLELGRLDEALQLNLQTRRSGSLQAVELAFNSYIAAKAGVRDEAVSALAFLKQSRENRYVPAITLCWLELALGQDGSAMDWLMIASREAEPYTAWLDVAPIYDSLRLNLGHSGVKV